MSVTLICDGCNENISPEDLKAGKARELQGSHYCQKCLDRLRFRRQERPAASRQAAKSPRRGIPSREGGGEKILRPRPGLHPAPVRPPSPAQTGPPESESGRRSPWGKREVLIVGGVVAGCVIFLVLVGIIIAQVLRPQETETSQGKEMARLEPSGSATPQKEQVERNHISLVAFDRISRIKKYLDPSMPLPEEEQEFFNLHQDLQVQERRDPTSRNTFRSVWKRIENEMALRAEQAFQKASKKAKKLKGEKKFEEAYESCWSLMPEMVRQVEEVSQKWSRESGRARKEASEWRNWVNRREGIEQQIELKDPIQIAAALQELEKYKTSFPVIRAERQELISRVRKLKEEVDLAIRTAEEEEDRRLMSALQQKSFIPMIPEEGTNLENWSIRTLIRESLTEGRYPWQIKGLNEKDEMSYALEADNSEGSSKVEIGVNGNRWGAWELEFQVKVEAGKLRLQVRTVLEREEEGRSEFPVTRLVAGGATRVRVREAASDSFEFPAENHREWSGVKVKALGERVRCLRDGKPQERIDAEGLKHGGFIFALDPGGIAKIRHVRLRRIIDN